MKKLLIALMFVCGSASAAEFNEFFHAVRAGVAVNQHGEFTDIYYTALATYHDGAGVDLAALNIGYEGQNKQPALLVGFRLDNVLPKLWTGAWGKAHIRTAQLPSFEVGPFVSVWPAATGGFNLSWHYGLSAAIGF